MEREEEVEWLEAQKINITPDLVNAAKKQLHFLATVDQNRSLYDGPLLQRAIFRYKNYWLPLLANHSFSEAPLVVPLDCEWIWHCHRLNPLRYKADCQEFYGQILDNKNVFSTVQGVSTKETQEIWNRLYPEEPYQLDLSSNFSDAISDNLLGDSKGTKYDLVSAVKRQVPFYFQVSKPVMKDDIFLQEAVARYKGFLHMIKRNKERSIRRFCVPTYDIDLIWHSHQLHPASYSNDLTEALGKVLEHDDTDSNRGKGQKLDTGFSGTTMQWEEAFGTRYWRAGGMYRGVAPSPVTAVPQFSNTGIKTIVPPTESQKIIHLSDKTVVEVLLEIVGVRNLPEGHKGNLCVFCSKKKPDAFFDGRRRLSILSETKGKQVASFQCEPTGELFFELMSYSPSSLRISKPAKTMGTTSISLQNVLDPVSKLSVEKWFELESSSLTPDSKPIGLRVAVSVTTPIPAPHVFRMVRSRPTLMNSCFFPLPGGKQHAKGWTHVIDEAGNEVLNIQMRGSKKSITGINGKPKREVMGVVGWSGDTHVLADFSESVWSLMDSNCSTELQKKCTEDGHIFELRGNRVVQLFPGRKLEYEPKNCQIQKNEGDYVTAVEFSKEYPYGNAVALINLKSGILKVEEEWFVMSGITLAYILYDILRREGKNVFIANGEILKKAGLVEAVQNVDGITSKNTSSDEGILPEKASVAVENGENEKHRNSVKEDAPGGFDSTLKTGGPRSMVKGGGCGSGCGGGCGGNMVSSAGCGSGCGGGCGGNMVNSAGCGSGCGGGCGGNMVSSAGCGSGCGGGCGGNMVNSAGCGGGCGGNMINSAGCGSGCGGGCGGDMVNSAGCGSGCGGGCGGNMVNSGDHGGNMVKSGGCGGGMVAAGVVAIVQ